MVIFKKRKDKAADFQRHIGLRIWRFTAAVCLKIQKFYYFMSRKDMVLT